MKAREIAGYRIVRPLRGGGMADLYVALDDRQKRVVVRTLSPNSAKQRNLKEGFERGAQVLAQLNHPSIVRYREHGYKQGVHYCVLEYIDGRGLREMIVQRDPVLAKHAYRLMWQLASALSYVHRKGYLHLDFKPENVLVRPESHALIIDFDLARKSGDRALKLKELPGTPIYMAPEMLATRLADERCDVFSFGVTCYEMLTQRKPFEGKTSRELQAAYVDPRTPATPPTRYRPDLPPIAEQVVLKCLAKQVRDRYPSMSLVVRDLKALL